MILISTGILNMFAVLAATFVNAADSDLLSAGSDTVTESVYITEDTYVWGGAYANNKYGSDPTLNSKEDAGDANYFKRAYMKVDLSNLNAASIVKAELIFYANQNKVGATITCSINKIINDTWSEATTNFNNRPDPSLPPTGDVIGNFNCDTNLTQKSVDVTNYIREQMLDKVVSFQFINTNSTISSINIKSSEEPNVNLRPYLRITRVPLNPVFSYRDSSDNTVNQFRDAASGSVQVDTGYPTTASLVLALYDTNGTMKDIAVDSKTTTSGNEASLSAKIQNLPSNLNGYYVQAYIWDSLAGIIPLGDSQLPAGMTPYPQTVSGSVPGSVRVDDNVVSIKGILSNVNAPKRVTLEVLSPDKTINEMNLSQPATIKQVLNHLYQVKTDASGNYEFKYTLDNSSITGIYNIRIGAEGITSAITLTFSYVTPATKVEIVNAMNHAEDEQAAANVLTQYMTIFDKFQIKHSLFNELNDSSVILKALLNQDFSDIIQIVNVYNKETVLQAVNEARDTTRLINLLKSNNDVLEIDFTTYDALTEKTKAESDMLNAVIAVPLKTTSEIKNKFDLFVNNEEQRENIRFYVSEDTFIGGGGFKDIIYGADSYLLSKEETADPNYFKRAYMKVDFTGLRAERIEKAELVFNAALVDPNKPQITCSVNQLNDDTWNETTTYHNNRPDPNVTGSQIGNFIVDKNLSQKTVDVTQYVKTKLDKKVVSFQFINTNSLIGAISIKSSEETNVSLKPYLKIKMKPDDPVFSYKDANNNPVNQLESAVSGTVQVDVMETTTSALILALYNRNGTVEKFVAEQKTIIGGARTPLTAKIDNLPTNLSGYYVQAYIWNSLTGLRPYGDVISTSGAVPFSQSETAVSEDQASVNNKVVTIKGKVNNKGVPKAITLVVINPKKDVSAIDLADPNTIKLVLSHVYQTKTDNSGNYAFRYTLGEDAHSGDYSVKLGFEGSNDQKLQTFKYNNTSMQALAVQAVNNAPDKAALLKAFTDFDSQLHIYYPFAEPLNDDSNVIGNILKTTFKSCDEILNTYLIEMITQAINESADHTKIANLLKTHRVELALDADNRYEVFLGNKFTDIEREEVYRYLFDSKPYESWKSLKDTFYSEMCKRVFNKLQPGLWGEVYGLLVDNNDVLGLDFTDYSNLNNNKKKNVATNMILSLEAGPYNGVADIKTKFNSYVEAEMKSTDTGKDSTGNSKGTRMTSSDVGSMITSMPIAIPNAEIVITDTDGHAWAKEAINYLVKNNIVEGEKVDETNNRHFNPQKNVTREQFIKMLISGLNLVDVTAESTFKDTDKGEWFYKYIASAEKLGITNGGQDGTFGIGREISRQEMAVMAYRALTVAKLQLQSIKSAKAFIDDNQIDQYAKEAVANMQQADIINGMEDNTFAPKDSASRAQAAIIIYKLIKAGS